MPAAAGYGVARPAARGCRAALEIASASVTRLLVVLFAVLVLVEPAFGAPPAVVARSYLVTNAATGEVLASRDAHARVPIASITKLMTVLVALDRARVDRQVVVDRQADVVGESSIGLSTGERLSLGDLIKA